MMSRRAALIRRERASVDRCGICVSFESGALRRLRGEKGVAEERVAVGRKKEVSTAGMDFVR